MTQAVTIRDRRTLPFFMVRLRALQEIRNAIGGPRRARALGLYALLCQLANEQRAIGEHCRLTATYKQLTRRGGLSPNSLKLILRALEEAGAARYEIRIDPLRGSLPSLIELPIQDDPWVGVTVDMAQRLAAQSEVRLLPALGLLVVLLELCDEQRETHGGLVAETTRTAIARRLGASTDSLDGWAKALQKTGVLSITRRRGTGGANLANLWEITEADTAAAQQQPAVLEGARGGSTPAAGEKLPGRGLDVPAPQTGSTLAAAGKHPPGERVVPAPGGDGALADERKCGGGESATVASAERPFNARRRDQAEGLTTEDSFPPTPAATRECGQGGRDADEEAIGLCEALLAVLQVSRGAGPARRYAEQRATWHAAAGRVLTDHPLDKLLDAIAFLEFDQVIGTKVRSMPDLERHIEDLRHRAHAARRQQPRDESGGAVSAPPWAQAQARIQAAIRRHGTSRATAAAELGAEHPVYEAFIDAVGWTSLCRDDPQRRQWDWQQAWKQACASTATETTEEAA